MIDSKLRQSVLTMRQQGAAYAEIADLLSLSPNTVKSICHRNSIQAAAMEKTDSDICRNCGRLLPKNAGSRSKIFCCDRCRYDWWNKERRLKPYRLVCCYCGHEFISFGNKNRRFCGRECYLRSRYGEGLP